MKVKDLLENYQGDNYIEIYDCFSWDTKDLIIKQSQSKILVISQCYRGQY